MYDPNTEATNDEIVVAGHRELLRRNKEFRSLSVRWLKSEKFRRGFVLTADYHDLQQHTPRCALDWMLTAAQRVRLAEFQIGKFRWFFDNRFNFGAIICREKLPPLALTRENGRNFVSVEPLPDAPPPITVEQSWDCVSNLFKEQFRLAYRTPNEFGEVNSRLAGLSRLLRVVGGKLAVGDRFNEMPIMAHILFLIGTELRDLAEFSKVFKIPKLGYCEKRFSEILARIRESFNASVPLTPTKKYDTHKSYQGTTEDWKWFLEAESLGLDIHRSADLWELSRRYCEELRNRSMRGKAPRRTKSRGFSGSAILSKDIKNSRNTVKGHVKKIEHWIETRYPPRTFDAGAI
jgi:hypothetical protein